MKKVLRILQASLITVFIYSPAVFAQDIRNNSKSLDYVQRTDSKMFDQISNAQNRAQALIDRYNIEVGNLQNRSANNETIQLQISNLTDKLDSDIDALIDNLIDRTNAEAGGVVLRAIKSRVEVTNEYIPVEIGGRIVLVDPRRDLGI